MILWYLQVPLYLQINFQSFILLRLKPVELKVNQGKLQINMDLEPLPNTVAHTEIIKKMCTALYLQSGPYTNSATFLTCKALNDCHLIKLH